MILGNWMSLTKKSLCNKEKTAKKNPRGRSLEGLNFLPKAKNYFFLDAFFLVAFFLVAFFFVAFFFAITCSS
jgi:hypothetical protein